MYGWKYKYGKIDSQTEEKANVMNDKRIRDRQQCTIFSRRLLCRLFVIAVTSVSNDGSSTEDLTSRTTDYEDNGHNTATVKLQQQQRLQEQLVQFTPWSPTYTPTVLCYVYRTPRFTSTHVTLVSLQHAQIVD